MSGVHTPSAAVLVPTVFPAHDPSSYHVMSGLLFPPSVYFTDMALFDVPYGFVAPVVAQVSLLRVTAVVLASCGT